MIVSKPGYNSSATLIAEKTMLKALTYNTDDFDNLSFAGAQVIVDATTVTSLTLTVSVYGVDPAQIASPILLLATTAMAAAGTEVLHIHPGAAAANNVSINRFMPKKFFIRAVTSNVTGTCTFTVGANFMGLPS